MHLASIRDISRHTEELGKFVNHLPLAQVHQGTLAPVMEDMQKRGLKTNSINRVLATARRILNLAARLWRDEYGMTWLETAPLIQLLPVTDARRPYPLSWVEQREMFQVLPEHLAKMCLYKVNTGCREQEVCKLRWDWEVQVPEMGTSVFIIPDTGVKNREDRLVVLNRVAKSVVKGERGVHPEFVFTYDGHPVTRMYNTAWKRARRLTGIPARIHDLKHTFGRRLRAAGVSMETRKVLLGHKNGDITTHYSAAELGELIEAANMVCTAVSDKSPTLVVLKRKAVN